MRWAGGRGGGVATLLTFIASAWFSPVLGLRLHEIQYEFRFESSLAQHSVMSKLMQVALDVFYFCEWRYPVYLSILLMDI